MLMPRFLIYSRRNSFLTLLVLGDFVFGLLFSFVCFLEGREGGSRVVLGVEVWGGCLFIVLAGFLAK